MATSIFDHPVVLIIIVAASLLRWLWQKSQEKAQDDPERPVVPNQPIPRGGETQTEEERIRRFLEALGQPPGSSPPSKVAPRKVQPQIFPTLPPLTTAPPPLPPPLPTPAPQKSPRPAAPARIFKPAMVQEAGFEVRDIAMQAPGERPAVRHQTDAAQSGLRLKLASKQDLRSAIILREIFGPPRSLQPFDPINSL
jgi:hypothetical protein